MSEISASKKTKRYECTFCERRYSNLSEITRHRRSHTKEKPYVCNECGKAFSLNSNLNRHKAIHSGIKPFECADCSKRFTEKGSLRKHVTIHTGEEPYKCAICERKFTQKAHYKAHMYLHTDETPVQCTICPKRFKNEARCQLHMKLHCDDRHFKCPKCGKAFKTKKVLSKHVHTHGDRVFKCSVCGKIYKSPSSLKHHMKNHEERKFQCHICESNFRKSDDLEKHVLEHETKKYRCSDCGKLYSSNKSVINHVRYHCAVEPILCPLCNKGFKRKDSARKHIRKCKDARDKITDDIGKDLLTHKQENEKYARNITPCNFVKENRLNCTNTQTSDEDGISSEFQYKNEIIYVETEEFILPDDYQEDNLEEQSAADPTSDPLCSDSEMISNTDTRDRNEDIGLEVKGVNQSNVIKISDEGVLKREPPDLFVSFHIKPEVESTEPFVDNYL